MKVTSVEQVVENLAASLNNLRNLLLRRVHEDIEAQYGIDSMLAPMTEEEEERELFQAKVEIEVYSIATAADEMTASNYADDQQWCLDWLTQLRLGDDVPKGVQQRLEGYLKRSLEKRRLLFSDVLVRSLPEAGKAPLVIFRLYPKAVRLAVAVAFNDPLRASECRNEQIAILPSITDCHQCHGRPLDSGDTCSECGSPLWKLRWLLAAD